MPSSNYYEALGVSPSASQDQIRDAFIRAAKELHPDLIDQAKHPEEWAKANEGMKFLNEVYGVLGDEETRAGYDAWLRGERVSRPAPQATPPHVDLSEVRGGVAPFETLSSALQGRLARIGTSAEARGFRLPQGSGYWAWFWLLAALAGSGGLLALVQAGAWNEDPTFVGECAAALAIVLGLSLASIFQSGRFPLRRTFILSPLYLIQCEFEKISFWPLWTMTKCDAQHHGNSNGGYSHTSVNVQLPGRLLHLRLSNLKGYNQFVELLNHFNAQARAALQQGTWNYFFYHDDFRNVPVEAVPPARRGLKRAALVFGCGLGLALLVALISQGAQSPVEQPVLAKAESPASGDVITYGRQRATVPVTVSALEAHDCLFSFWRPSDRAQVLSVYVRKGETARITVPPDTYQLDLASGEEWNGYATLFGPATTRLRSEAPVVLREGGSLVSIKADQPLFRPL